MRFGRSRLMIRCRTRRSSQVLHCFEGGSGDVVTSTYAHSTRTGANLCTCSQWVGVSTHQVWTASARTTTAFFRPRPRMSPLVGNRRTPRCGCDGQSRAAALLLGRSMLADCKQMCQHCEVRRNRDTPSSGGALATQVMKDPPFPFHTGSINHKTVTAPKGTAYQYILVIVNMLPRFVTAVSCATTSVWRRRPSQFL
eukprot:5681484-Pleurochrysis_carterae.AAC.3